MITYAIFPFKFNTVAWSRTIRNWIDVVGVEMIAEIIEADKNTILNWSRGAHKEAYPYPSMTLFLRACNALDLDPRHFFELAE